MSMFAIYGNICIEREFCHKCGVWCLVIDGKKMCCNKTSLGIPLKFKRFSEPEARRSSPKGKRAEKIVSEQGGLCFYCGARFGAFVSKNGKKRAVKLVWDHKVPYSYSQNNRIENFVAACSHCNNIKSDKFFQTLEEAQLYILQKLSEKGFSYARDIMESNS